MLPLRVLVADDHRLFRQGLVGLLSTRPDLVNVVGEAGSGQEAVILAEQVKPDLVLMDIYMPEGDGLAAARAIRQQLPDTNVVILTASETDEHFQEAIQLGVAGYLLKNLDANELFDLIEGVERGEAALTRAMASRLLKSAASKSLKEGKNEEKLSEREIEVLRLLAQGHSNPQISEELNISVNTVKTHISHILNKLHLKNRTQAAAYAIHHRLVNEET